MFVEGVAQCVYTHKKYQAPIQISASSTLLTQMRISHAVSGQPAFHNGQLLQLHLVLGSEHNSIG